jgi:hypothetical protein
MNWQAFFLVIGCLSGISWLVAFAWLVNAYDTSDKIFLAALAVALALVTALSFGLAAS